MRIVANGPKGMGEGTDLYTGSLAWVGWALLQILLPSWAKVPGQPSHRMAARRVVRTARVLNLGSTPWLCHLGQKIISCLFPGFFICKTRAITVSGHWLKERTHTTR